MCLIAFHWNPGSRRPLVLAANRDEFHARPTRPLHWWRWPDGVLAGRDEQAGGTWLAVRRDGRWAAITNFRDSRAAAGSRSRGELPLMWLEHTGTTGEFGRSLHDRRHHYGPFNLVFGDFQSLWIVGTHTDPAPVESGTHALSNHLLDTPWPKSICAVERMTAWQAGSGDDLDSLLDLLDDRRPARDEQLPETGVGLEFERLLSAPFVVSPRYGTRSSSGLVLDERIRVAERNFDAAGACIGQRMFGWAAPARQ